MYTGITKGVYNCIIYMRPLVLMEHTENGVQEQKFVSNNKFNNLIWYVHLHIDKFI